jgi:glycosyltransferase involved in cell wall biosynthesis
MSRAAEIRRTGSQLDLCLISPSFVPTYGGAELRFRRYLPGLHERGVHTRLVIGTPKLRKATAADLASEDRAAPPGQQLPAEPLDGCPVHRVRLPDAGASARMTTLLEAAVGICRTERTHVAQIIGELPQATLPWLKRLRTMGIPIVFAASVTAQPAAGAWREWRRRRVVRKVMGALDCIVALNGPLRDELRALGLRTRIEVIPNGVDLERFRPPAGPVERARRAELGLVDEDRLIVFAGSIHPRKGVDLLLESFARLAPRYPRLHVALAGPRRDLEMPRLREFRAGLEAAAGAAPSRVHFLGEIVDVEALLRAADLFVFPSRREGMPNAVLEAMATGLPVVLCPFAGLSRELGEAGRHHLLAPHDPAALADVVSELLDAPERGRALGAEARAWLEKTMDLRETLDRYAALYRELAAAERERAG